MSQTSDGSIFGPGAIVTRQINGANTVNNVHHSRPNAARARRESGVFQYRVPSCDTLALDDTNHGIRVDQGTH